jgi:hypothetical protein
MRAMLRGGLAAGLGLAAGCSDPATNPAQGSGELVSLSFAGVAAAGASGAQALAGTLADTLVVAVGNDTLRITSVELVLREVELKRLGVEDCDSTAADDDCEEFETGPILVSLPLAPGAQQAVEVVVDSGTYSEVEFDIHKPGDDSLDLAFVAANPDFADISIRVRGTFNGTPFTFLSRLNEEQELALVPPLVVTASGASANLTILLDVSTWFRQPGSGALIDPATANEGGANENVVRDNIKNSIEAFEDDDRDGEEDGE